MFGKWIGGYYPIDSKLHKVHPTCKILCFLLFLFMCFFVRSLESIFVVCMFLCILILLSNIPLESYFGMFYRMRYLVLFILLLWFFAQTSFEYTMLSIMRIFFVIGYTSMLFYTTKPLDMMVGIESVFSCFTFLHIPVHKIAFSISLAFHFIPILFLQGNKILASQASRGLDYQELSLKQKFLVIQSLILPMFVLSIRRADQLSEVMEVRLYDVGKKHTYYLGRWSLFDKFLLFSHMLLCIIIFVKR